MCIASVIKSAITADQIKRMADHNPDGGGLAWIAGPNLIAFRKGLTADEVIALVEKIPRPFLMHFRIATRGGKRPELTHPFPIGFEAFGDDLVGFSDRGVLIHNGSSSAFDHLLPKGIEAATASDTQIAAYAAGLDESVLDRLTWSNALLRPNGSICARGSWTVEDGNHYSNMHWKTKVHVFSGYTGSYGNAKNWQAWDAEDWSNWRENASPAKSVYSGPGSSYVPTDRSARGTTSDRASRTGADTRSWRQIKQDREDAKRERKIARRAARRALGTPSDGVILESLDDRETEPMRLTTPAIPALPRLAHGPIPTVERPTIVRLPAHLGTPSSYPPTVRGPQLDLMMGRGPSCERPEPLVGDPYDRATSYTFSDPVGDADSYLDPAYAAVREQIQRDGIKMGGRK